jgi:hypothetical protein
MGNITNWMIEGVGKISDYRQNHSILLDGLCKNLHFQEAMALFNEGEDKK